MTISLSISDVMYIIAMCLTIAGLVLWRRPEESMILMSSGATLSVTAAALLMLGVPI